MHSGQIDAFLKKENGRNGKLKFELKEKLIADLLNSKGENPGSADRTKDMPENRDFSNHSGLDINGDEEK